MTKIMFLSVLEVSCIHDVYSCFCLDTGREIGTSVINKINDLRQGKAS